MEEYEVDLRDYLRVIWRKKWIILGVFLVAIVAALLLSLRAPNQYEAEALMQLNDLPQIARIRVQVPSPQVVLVILRSRDLLARTAEEAKLAEEEPFQRLTQEQLVEWLRGHLKASIPEKSSLIEVKIAAVLDPQLLEGILDKHLRVLEEQLEEDVSNDAKQEITRLTSEEGVLKEQQDSLIQEIEGRIAERKAILERQRTELLQQLSAIEQDKGKLGLQAGEQNATLEGVILREQFIALNSRLQQIERELDDLELRGREMFPDLNSRIRALDREIGELQVAAEKARELFNHSREPLNIISQSPPSSAPIGPNRKMNVAVAGVLGLFVGILLAFFIHYMEGGKEVEEKE